MCGSFWDVVVSLLSHDARITNWVRCSFGLDHHPFDFVVKVHVLQVSKVEMEAATMPESEIQRTSTGIQSYAGHLSLLRHKNTTIQVPHIRLRNGGSKMQITRVAEANLFTFDVDFVAFEASEVKKK